MVVFEYFRLAGLAMQKSSAILTCVLFFAGIGSLEAQSLNSPGVVYIDEQPCNRACQAYMAWSRQTMPMFRQGQRPLPSVTAGQRSPKALANRATGVYEAGSKLATPARAAKQPAANAVGILREKTTGILREKITDLRATETAATTSDTVSANGADAPHRVGIGVTSLPRATQAMAAMADRKEPKQKTNSSVRSEAVLPRASEPAEPALSKQKDPRIAIVMARPEIKSVSDLAGKNIAIEDKQSASGGVVRIAIAAAGATGVHLAASPVKAFDRVIDGEVPAAVLMLAYPEAAEAFPDITGFNIFRIPLTPQRPQVTRTDLSPPATATAASDSARAKIEDLRPIDAVAPASHTRTTQELVTAAMAVAERMTTAATTADPHPIASAPANDADPRIAIVMARSDIKSLSDLAGKTIAIDDKQSSNGNVRTAIAAAADAQVSEDQRKAIDRLIGGEVSAALLTSVSREAADAFPEIAGFKIFRIPLVSETPRAKIADLAPANKPPTATDITGAVADDSRRGKIQDLVMAATAVAERMSVAVADQGQSEQKANSNDRSDHPAAALAGAEATAASSGDSDPRVAVLMARPDIKSVSDLAGKEIAIDDKQSASSRKVRTAIAAAGAAQVQISEGQTKAINRLMLAQVPAAVLTLVSPEAAEAFPEVAGYRIFRIPLSPSSVLIKHP